MKTVGRLEAIAATSPTCQHSAGAALIDEQMQKIPACIASKPPCAHLPNFVIALVVRNEVPSRALDQVVEHSNVNHLFAQVAMDNNVRTVNESGLVPLFAVTRLPLESAHVAELSTASTS